MEVKLYLSSKNLEIDLNLTSIFLFGQVLLLGILEVEYAKGEKNHIYNAKAPFASMYYSDTVKT